MFLQLACSQLIANHCQICSNIYTKKRHRTTSGPSAQLNCECSKRNFWLFTIMMVTRNNWLSHSTHKFGAASAILVLKGNMDEDIIEYIFFMRSNIAETNLVITLATRIAIYYHREIGKMQET